jgi:uncharacterized Zn finger protein
MPRLPLIKRGMIRANTSASEMSEGSDYFNREYVHNVILGDSVITAQVQDKKTPSVQIGFSKHRIEYAQCSCHYFRTHDHWCRHVAATLLYVNKHEKQLQQQYRRLMQYKKFNKSNLIELLDYLVYEEPMNSVLIQKFALELANPAAQAEATPAPQQEQAVKILPAAPEEFEDSAEKLQEFREALESALETPIIYRKAHDLIGEIEVAIDDQRADLALAMIDLMAQAYAQQIPEKEDLRFDPDGINEVDIRVYERYSEQLEDLAKLFNAALPIANLPSAQAQEWIAKIESWLQVEDDLFSPFKSAISVLQS